MKTLGRDILIAFVAGVVMPVMLVRVGLALRAERREVPTPLTVTEPSEETGSYPSRQILFRDTDGSAGAVELEEYLVGAVLGEMPASFGQEALKAQAVAARTYAWKAAMTGSRHPDGSVCPSPANSSTTQVRSSPPRMQWQSNTPAYAKYIWKWKTVPK